MRKMIEFDSGLKLVFVQNTAVRSVAIGVFVGAGVVTEDAEQAGISHLIEHMVFKGTHNRSSFDIVNEIDCIGAQINAFTTKSYTCYYTVSLDTNSRKCADVLSDLYFNPAFAPQELEKERRVVMEEINESEDAPDDLCLERLSTAFFKGHALGKPILGTKATLKAMTSDTLKEYKAKHYTPSNTIISIAGNLTESEAVAIVNDYFEKNCAVAEHTPREAVSKAKTNSTMTRKKKEIEQAHIAFAFPAMAFNDERNVSMQLMTSIFGMEMSSRLFQSVRERLGLCYTIVGYPSTYENNGSFIIYTSTNPQSVEAAVKAIRREIELLVSEGISDEELNKGKEQLKTSLVLGQESTSAMMRAFGRHAIQTGELYDFDYRIAQIDAATKEDIRSTAAYIFDMSRAAASIVAANDDLDLLKILKSDN